MLPVDRSGPIIDFACGAGEILEQFAKFAGVVAGLDFSSSMLSEARLRLADTPVKLIQRDGFSYCREAEEPVWTTCQGMNQYLSPVELLLWIDTFASNPSAKALYMFDCIDPLRRKSLTRESIYADTGHMNSRSIRRVAWRIKTTARNIHHAGWADLGSAAMGYGYTPQFFRRRAAQDDFTVEFGSSLYFEYRFHVALRKNAANSQG